MCGITGVYHYKTEKPVSEALIHRMTDVLHYRGPDDSGCHMNGCIGLGFRRLSIIDHETGNQPITNEDGSVIVVCNGEIFNYKALKASLMARGHRFYTQSDIEVLVHLYEEYGTDFFSRLNGQYGLAIYDAKERILLLARDHAGIAPLFYSETEDGIVFGSEVKSILQHPQVSPSVDLTALDQVFTFPGVVSPFTMFDTVRSIRPGHKLIVKENMIRDEQYWDLDYPPMDHIEIGRPITYYIDRLEALLTESVNYRLQADVPVGFYLSGGIDSSIIAAMIHKHHREKRHSFSIGFQQAEIDERFYQKLMAKSVGSIHHEVLFDWQEIALRLSDAVYHTECPLKESFDTCSLALSELAKNSGIKVVLNGEGSDELFAGYIGYRYDAQRHNLSFQPMGMEMMMEEEIRQRLWGDPDFHYERHLYEFQDIKQAIYSDGLNEQFPTFDCTMFPLIDQKAISNRHPIHKRSYIDFKFRLADHLLSDHGDRVAHANSVEARYPFLDIDLIAFIRTIPPDYLVHEGTEKYMLKQFARGFLPAPIVNREKFAFTAPGSPYLLKQNIEWINDLLSYETIKRQGYFNPDAVERLKAQYRSDAFSLMQVLESDLLMIMLTFGIFLERFRMPDFTC